MDILADASILSNIFIPTRHALARHARAHAQIFFIKLCASRCIPDIQRRDAETLMPQRIMVKGLRLVKLGLLDTPVLYLSRYINQNKSEYYRLLQTVRDKHEWEAWVFFIFLKGLSKLRVKLRS